MKKIITAVLMLTVMMFSAVAQVPTDITDELAAFGIMVGDPDGNLRLEDNVTRAEAAKMVMSLLGLRDIKQEDTSFEDVSVAHWASGYINLAQAVGVVNGISETRFAPVENVTNEQIVKMLITALGYAPMTEMMGGYPFGYMKLAAQKGILNGVDSIIGTMPATRGDIAVMIHNSIDTPIMVQTGFGAEVNYEIMDGENGVALETPRNKFLGDNSVVDALKKAQEKQNEKEEVPRYSGEEYVGRILKIADMKEKDGKITFTNSLNEDDKTVYVVTEDTFIYESVNTVTLDEIADGKYAQCWHYNDDKAAKELLKIEIMKEKPKGIE